MLTQTADTLDRVVAPFDRAVHAFFGATTAADLTGRAEGAPGSSPHLHRSAAGGDTP